MRFGPVYLELCLCAHPVVAAVELVFHLLFSDSYNHYWRKFVPGNSTDVPLDSGKQNCELNCLLIIYFSVVERTLSRTKKNAEFFSKTIYEGYPPNRIHSNDLFSHIETTNIFNISGKKYISKPYNCKNVST